MQAEELLVLNYGDFSSRVDTMYARLKEQPQFRDLFVRNPMRVIFSTVMPGVGSPTDEQVAISNRFLFSLFSSPKFMDWVQSYGKRLESQLFDGLDERCSDKDRFERVLNHIVEGNKLSMYNDFLEGMLQFGDVTLLNAFATPGSIQPGPLTPQPGAGGDNPCNQGGRVGPDPKDPSTWCPTPTPRNPIGPAVDGNGNVVAVPVVIIAVAVVVVVVALAHPSPSGITRADIAAISDSFVTRIVNHSTKLRRANVLEPGSFRVNPSVGD